MARIFKWEELLENKGCSKFADWEDFQDELRKEFTPAHADLLAINHLESTMYYQKVLPKESLPRRQLHRWISGPRHGVWLHGPKDDCRQVPPRAQPPNAECCCDHGIREALWQEPHKVVWDGMHTYRIITLYRIIRFKEWIHCIGQ